MHTTMWTNPKETILNEKDHYYSSMTHSFISITSLKYESYTDRKQISLGRRRLRLLTGLSGGPVEVEHIYLQGEFA